jgi:hypothetical protein
MFLLSCHWALKVLRHSSWPGTSQLIFSSLRITEKTVSYTDENRLCEKVSRVWMYSFLYFSYIISGVSCAYFGYVVLVFPWQCPAWSWIMLGTGPSYQPWNARWVYRQLWKRICFFIKCTWNNLRSCKAIMSKHEIELHQLCWGHKTTSSETEIMYTLSRHTERRGNSGSWWHAAVAQQFLRKPTSEL